MNLQNYVDGFLCPVKTQDRERYLAVATAAAALFKKHGALSVGECWGDAKMGCSVNARSASSTRNRLKLLSAS